MRLTIENHPERIKRYSHVKPAGRGVARCSTQCPGTVRTCTLKRGHSGPHVAHGSFRKVVAVWDARVTALPAKEKPKKPVRSTPGIERRKKGFLAGVWKWLRGRVANRIPSVEEVFLLFLALSMVAFAIDWALRIIGWK